MAKIVWILLVKTELQISVTVVLTSQNDVIDICNSVLTVIDICNSVLTSQNDVRDILN